MGEVWINNLSFAVQYLYIGFWAINIVILLYGDIRCLFIFLLQTANMKSYNLLHIIEIKPVEVSPKFGRKLDPKFRPIAPKFRAEPSYISMRSKVQSRLLHKCYVAWYTGQWYLELTYCFCHRVVLGSSFFCACILTDCVARFLLGNVLTCENSTF